MKNIIVITYLSILLPIMGVVYNAPQSINLLINGILFISSISMLFLIYFYEKGKGKLIHLIPLSAIYTIYNFMINPFLGIVGVFVFFMIYKKHKNKNYDLSNLNSIIPLMFLFSKISKIDYLVVFSYLSILIYHAI
ncbi:MAG: hypothetical protein HF967_07460 [Methanosarcinales archaeon]|nr:hypothetical protein [Methanosarcinales archaeon]